MSQSDYLIHYGVMGMKWGIRKDGKPQGYQSGKRRSSKSSLSKTTGHSKVSKPGSNAQSGSSASSKKSTNPNPKKYEVWDETMTRKENIAWNKEHNAGPADARKAKKQAERRQIQEVKKQRKEDAHKRTLLTDKELDAKIERLSKEKRLKELTDSEVSPGKQFVKDITGITGRKVAVAALTTVTAAVVANKLGGEVHKGRAATDFYKQATKTK